MQIFGQFIAYRGNVMGLFWLMTQQMEDCVF